MANENTAKVIQWVAYRPSNGSEGSIFAESFCDRCKKDVNGDCEIRTRALAWDVDDEGYPQEWIIPEDATEWPGEAQCTAFEAA